MLWIQWRLSTILKTSRKMYEMCFDVSKNTYILKVYLDTIHLDKINGTKNAFFFLSRAPTHHSFTLNL